MPTTSETTMRAAWYDALGPAQQALQIGTQPVPAPAAGEILARIHTSGINPSDVKKRAGARGPMQFPRIIPHSDGAGIIEAVGPNIPETRIGERVWFWNAQGNRPFGTAAEYIALPADQAVPLPDNLSLADGACLGIPAMTAHVALNAGEAAPRPDLPHLQNQTLLVTGANGAVAHYAIGFAKQAGARVIATTGNPAAADHAQAMGCDHILPHASANPETFAQSIADITADTGIHTVITSEFGSIIETLPPLLRQGGRIVSYGSELAPTPPLPFYPLMFKNAALHLIFLYQADPALRAAAVTGINHFMGNGKIPAVIDSTFPLEEIAAAHERVESGDKRGMVILTLT